MIAAPEAGGERLPLTCNEGATRADPKTQTFEVRYTKPTPMNFTLLPGMKATVTADLREIFGEEQASFTKKRKTYPLEFTV